MPEEFTLPSKRILIEFIGGDGDGLYLDSASANETESQFAQLLYLGTENGTIGRGIQGMPMAWLIRLMKGEKIEMRGYSPHEYRIAERIEEDTEIFLRMHYKGQVTGTASKPDQKRQ